MEISSKFTDALYNGFYHLPKHSQQAMQKAVVEGNLFRDIFEKQKKLLIENYSIPEYVFESSAMIEDYMRYNFEDDDYYNQGAFRYLYNFVSLCYHELIPYNSINREEHSMLMTSIRLSIMISEIDESEGPENAGMVSRYPNFKSKDKDGKPRKVRARFARVFNQQFPGFPEAVVDGLNDLWKDSYGVYDFEKYHIHVGRTEDHFLAAYENMNIATASNIDTTVFTKHLANSCMQYERSDDDGWDAYAIESGLHCIQAYATKDTDFEGLKSKRFFEVMYMTDKKDPFDYDAHVFARAVFSRKENGFPEFGPFYVTSNMSKKFMLSKVSDLVSHLPEEDQTAFSMEFNQFLHKTDNKDCYDYPAVWEGSILRAYSVDGDQLSVNTYVNNVDCHTTVVSPYIDVGAKRALPVLNSKNGLVYLSVMNKDTNLHPDYDKESEMIVYNDFGVKPSRFCDHQGINYLQPVRVREKCSCCGIKKTRLRDVKEKRLCRECVNKYYTSCYVTNELVLKKETKKVNLASLFYSSDSFSYSEICRHRISMEHDFLCTSLVRRICFDYVDVKKDLVLTTVDKVIINGDVSTNVSFHEDSVNHLTVVVDGTTYVKFDDRIAFDFEKNEIVAYEDRNSVWYLRFSYGYDTVYLKVSDNIVDILKKQGISHVRTDKVVTLLVEDVRRVVEHSFFINNVSTEEV